MPGQKSSNAQLKGLIFTLLGGLFWGISGTNSEFLMKNYNLSPLWVSAFRFFFSGVCIMTWLLIKQREKVINFLKIRSHYGTLILFSFFGLLGNSLTYLICIEATNAGTATVIQYTAPILVLIYTCLRFQRKPSRKELVAIVCTIVGVFLITTHGDPRQLVISPRGLTWGIISAVMLCLYNIIPGKLIARWGSLMISGFAMIIAGSAEMLYLRPWEEPIPLDPIGWAALLFCIFMGTLLAYVLYLQGVQLVGPVKASMLASIEPVVATICTALVMGTSFAGMDILGFAFILVTIFILRKD